METSTIFPAFGSIAVKRSKETSFSDTISVFFLALYLIKLMVRILERGIISFHLIPGINLSNRLAYFFMIVFEIERPRLKIEMIVKCKGLQLSILFLTLFIIFSCYNISL